MSKTKNDVNIKAVGTRLKQIRFLLNMRQIEMAKVLNISNSHYSKLEIGIGGISNGLLFSASQKFGITYDWLANGVGQTPNSVLDIKDPRKDTPLPHCHSLLQEDDFIEKILLEANREDLKNLSIQISKTLHITYEHALAMTIKESLRNPNQEQTTES
ncbi:MAG: helix-turn-helix domain-containing protein [Lentisphaeria bacterium]